MSIPSLNAEMSAYSSPNRYVGSSRHAVGRSLVTPQACRRVCRSVVRPELCLFIPFPFCLLPQRECNTLCSV